jgi:dihydroxyacetone kinase
VPAALLKKTPCAAVLQALDTSGIGLSRPYATVADIAQILEANMGGTSGASQSFYLSGRVHYLSKPPSTFAVFDLYLTALSTFLRPSSDSQSQPDPTLWTTAPLRALQSLSTHTPARPGDRTLIDALSPFCTTLDKEGAASLGKAVEAAHQGAEATRKMRPRLGRAVYVGIDERDPGRSEVPDPGAWGVAALLRGLLNGLESSRRSAG